MQTLTWRSVPSSHKMRTGRVMPKQLMRGSIALAVTAGSLDVRVAHHENADSCPTCARASSVRGVAKGAMHRG